MRQILIKGGTLLDPLQRIHDKRDILISGGKIAAVGHLVQDDAVARDALVVDVCGKLVMPGLIDLHVHLREPGQEEKETIASGCSSAIAGGFTALACMPNTEPVADEPGVIHYIKGKVEELVSSPRVYPVGAISRGLKGAELADIEGMHRAGIRAISDDGKSVVSSFLMVTAMEKAKDLGLKIFSHCDDPELVRGHMNQGKISSKLGIEGIPNVSESLMVARDIQLSRYTGCPLHIQHVSTAESVELIAWAKDKGLPVSAEVTPHHLLLTDAAVEDSLGDAKMNPPLRSEADRQSLIRALREGVIDCIATDHAPHTPAEKAGELSQVPFGVVGLETALPLMFTKFVETNLLTLEELVWRLSITPARILGIKGGTLAVGSPADITVVDLKKERRVERESFLSQGKNTPFEGWPLRGWPVMTIVGGNVVTLIQENPNEEEKD